MNRAVLAATIQNGRMAQERFFGENAMPDILEQWRAYFRLLDPQRGDRILDVGCHEGDAIALLLEEQPGVLGVVGLDRNHQRCVRARGRFAGDARVAVVRGDAVAVSLAAAAFDRIYCADVLEWTSEPTAALKEIRRMLAPDGVALVVHTDFDTQVFAADDLGLTRRIVHAFTDHAGRGTIGRDLFGLCAAAGFSRVDPSVRTLVGTSFTPDRYPWKIVKMLKEWLVDNGEFHAATFDEWVRRLVDRNRLGTFFYSVNRNICVCRR